MAAEPFDVVIIGSGAAVDTSACNRPSARFPDPPPEALARLKA